MGLTIHYQLRTNLGEPSDVADLGASPKEAAGRLPFRRVGPVEEFRDAQADFARSGRDDEYRWLKIQACRHLEVGDHYVKVKPRHVFAFKVDPGAGCEPAHFGFCRFPPVVAVDAPGNGREGTRPASTAGAGVRSARRSTPPTPTAAGSRTSSGATSASCACSTGPPRAVG